MCWISRKECRWQRDITCPSIIVIERVNVNMLYCRYTPKWTPGLSETNSDADLDLDDLLQQMKFALEMADRNARLIHSIPWEEAQVCSPSSFPSLLFRARVPSSKSAREVLLSGPSLNMQFFLLYGHLPDVATQHWKMVQSNSTTCSCCAVS